MNFDLECSQAHRRPDRVCDVNFDLAVFQCTQGQVLFGMHRSVTSLYADNAAWSLLLLLSTPLHQRAASRVQHSNHVAANSLSPQVARKGSTLSGFVQRSRLETEVGRDLHSNKWEEV